MNQINTFQHGDSGHQYDLRNITVTWKSPQSAVVIQFTTQQKDQSKDHHGRFNTLVLRPEDAMQLCADLIGRLAGRNQATKSHVGPLVRSLRSTKPSVTIPR